jgi:hypothetical protein
MCVHIFVTEGVTSELEITFLRVPGGLERNNLYSEQS